VESPRMLNAIIALISTLQVDLKKERKKEKKTLVCMTLNWLEKIS